MQVIDRPHEEVGHRVACGRLRLFSEMPEYFVRENGYCRDPDIEWTVPTRFITSFLDIGYDSSSIYSKISSTVTPQRLAIFNASVMEGL